MSSKKTASNRRNAQSSTGPRDTSVTRYNAVRHGLTSAQITPFDLDIYEPTLQHYRAELQPAGEIEDLLVQRIALYATRLLRAAGLSADYMREAMKPSIPDVSVGPRFLDHVTYAATGQMPERPASLRTLAAAIQDLPGQITTLIDTGESPDLAAALNRFADAVDALPGAKKTTHDALAIVETLETRFQRYETQLENRMLRLLNELERIQRLRAGEDIPAPLNVNIAVEGTGAGVDMEPS